VIHLLFVLAWMFRDSEMKENREQRIQKLVTRGHAANLEAALSAMRLNPLLSALR
jgi:hypothetical protein